MLGIVGWLIYVIGLIWMVVTAVQTGKDTSEKAIWGLVCFFCSPLGSIIFFIVKRQGLIPLIMMIAGFIVMIAGGGFSFNYNMGQ
ncbi:MAG: PLDc N-terminal domain-containing protein [Pyrinomonadaceae bacterium]|nr:PLDc N-terminal domain-containing protein [Acidobacteriota bacterium]MBK7933001.1 PLDc N-terminal domain-containing protein [Acidobacteriota bacterium]MBP7376491.1 PLDc N-terminal domain-containing protein [Pyrinomonadaceae bacterium]